MIFYSGRAKSHDYEVMKVRPCLARTKEIEGTTSQCFQRR